MRGTCALAAAVAVLLLPAAAPAAVVSISGSTVTYAAKPGEANAVQIRRQAGNIDFTNTGPGNQEFVAGSGCTLSGTISCPDTGITRVLATTLDGQDAVGFSDLGSILGEADLGPGNDAANPVDQTQPFRLVLRGGPGRDDRWAASSMTPSTAATTPIGSTALGGPDDLRGGAGFDELRYDLAFPARAAGVHVTIDDLADDGDALGEQDNAHTDIEDLTGTDQNDVLVGSEASNVIVGLGGNDQITGAGNFDVLFGDSDFLGPSGNDTIFARDGIGERINCGAGTDTVVSDDIDGVSECETNDTSPDAVLDRDQEASTSPATATTPTPRSSRGSSTRPRTGSTRTATVRTP